MLRHLRPHQALRRPPRRAGGDCLAQTSHGAETLTNPEPGLFILGSKSYGRNNTFLMRVGWEQVGEVFGLPGG